MFLLRIVCFSGLFMATALFVYAEATVEEITKYTNTAVENRLKIKSWHVLVQKKYFDAGIPDDRDEIESIEYYVDGKRDRTDATYRYAKKMEGREDTYTDYRVRDGEHEYFYSSEVDDLGRKTALSAAPITEITGTSWVDREKRAALKVGDFRILGFSPNGMDTPMHEIPMFVYNVAKKHADVKMVDEVLNGVQCKKITVLGRRGKPGEITSYVRLWIAPEQGCGVVRFEAEPGSRSFLDRTDVTLAKHAKSGLWVPVKSAFERIRQGKIETSEYLDIEILSLNERIPDMAFDPATMHVPVGTTVHASPPPVEPMFWDGKKITTDSGAAYGYKLEPAYWSAFRIFLVSTGLLLIAIGCFFRFFTKPVAK